MLSGRSGRRRLACDQGWLLRWRPHRSHVGESLREGPGEPGGRAEGRVTRLRWGLAPCWGHQSRGAACLDTALLSSAGHSPLGISRRLRWPLPGCSWLACTTGACPKPGCRTRPLSGPPWALLAAAQFVSLISCRWIFPEGVHASRPASPPQAGPLHLPGPLCASHRAPEGWLAGIATWAFLAGLLPHRVTCVPGSTGQPPEGRERG